MKWCNKYFLKKEYHTKNKNGLLILTGGGSSKPDNAIDSAKIIFKILNANFDINKDYIFSLETNKLPAKNDPKVIQLLDKAIKNISTYNK